MIGNDSIIDRVKRVPLRTVWAHEATSFTKWLERNIDIVNEVLDIELTVVERESNAGDFKLDLLAEDGSGRPVVIENQLERSDHDHLGKLLTYLAAFDAKAAVWIVGETRPEHVAAMAWLNESSGADFYLLKVEAITIGDSKPAPLFTQIVGPSVEQKTVGEDKKNLSDREKMRANFWSQLLERARTRSNLHSTQRALTHPWLGAGSGTRGLTYNYGVKQRKSSVFLYIDRGAESDAENIGIFEYLHDRREQIEAVAGSELRWERLEGKRAVVISFPEFDGGYRDPESSWPPYHDRMIEAMLALERAFGPHLVSAVRAGEAAQQSPIPTA